MVEKQLRLEIHETIQELVEIKEELLRRFRSMKRQLKPAAAVVFAYVGIRVGLNITRMVLRHKLFLLVLLAVVLAKLGGILPGGKA